MGTMLNKVSKKQIHRARIEHTVITPSIAKAWLENNDLNRSLKRLHIDELARDIGRSQWMTTGETIKFDDTGKLIDGQHRLLACIKADKPFPTYVIYGLPPAVKNVIDTGKKRSNSDILAMQGIKNTVCIAAALKLLINERDGHQHRQAVSHSEIVQAFEKHPKIELWVPMPGSLPRGMPSPLAGYIAYVGGHILGKKERATSMMRVLKTGESDYDGDPIHKFRERALRARDGDHAIRGRDQPA